MPGAAIIWISWNGTIPEQRIIDPICDRSTSHGLSNMTAANAAVANSAWKSGPVRLFAFFGSNQDQDWLAFAPRPKKTRLDWR